MFNSVSPIKFPRVIAFALILGVVLPSACVLWFMLEAMNNEKLAVRQKLNDVYKNQLQNINTQWRKHWEDKFDKLNTLNRSELSSKVFLDAVLKGYVSSAYVVSDIVEHSYPGRESIYKELNADYKLWQQAMSLEFKEKELNSAVKVYQSIAQNSVNSTSSARAYQAWSRCLLKLGKFDSAFDVLESVTKNTKYKKSKTKQGRLIIANVLMQLLDIINKQGMHLELRHDFEYQLMRLANDYDAGVMPAQQRLFIMNSLPSYSEAFQTLFAERLANKYLQNLDFEHADIQLNTLTLVDFENTHDFIQDEPIWRAKLSSGVTALFTLGHLKSELSSMSPLGGEGELMLLSPFESANPSEENIIIPVGDLMPGWHIGFYIDTSSGGNGRDDVKVAAYLWVGFMFVTCIVFVFVFIFRYMFKQEVLTHLKNDLMDTVTHELKTPLSSIRMFVEILLNRSEKLDEQAVEYLNLIDKENRRLTRLIDSFLSFSRLDKKNKKFDFTDVDLVEVVEPILVPFKQASNSKDYSLDMRVSLAEGLPKIKGDYDLLTMLVSNIVDNAFKYSGANKVISVTLFSEAQDVVLTVSDNGVGLSKSTSKQIFDRFYRSDRKLTQSVDGCGLGLNIAKHIVDEHSGKISVESELDVGSVFRVSFPAIKSGVMQ